MMRHFFLIYADSGWKLKFYDGYHSSRNSNRKKPPKVR